MARRMSRQRFLSIRGRPDPGAGALPKPDGVVRNPAGSPPDLRLLALIPADLVAAAVEQHELGAGVSLVERTDEIGPSPGSRMDRIVKDSRCLAQKRSRISNETGKVQPWGPAEKLTCTDG